VNLFDELRHQLGGFVYVRKRTENERMMSGALRDYRGGRRMIYGYVAAFVVTPAHIAISGHFLAALHFDWRHSRIGQAGEQRRSYNQQRNEERNDSAQLHNSILP
jgi:hypothetical protein